MKQFQQCLFCVIKDFSENYNKLTNVKGLGNLSFEV